MLYERQGARARARPRGARNSVATPPSPLYLLRVFYFYRARFIVKLEFLIRKIVLKLFRFFLNFEICVFFLFFFLFAPVLSLELKFVNGFTILSDIYCLIDNLDFSSRD